VTAGGGTEEGAAGGRRKRLFILPIRKDKAGKKIWTRIGAVWPNKSGKGALHKQQAPQS
jgi:hypothetical protein